MAGLGVLPPRRMVVNPVGFFVAMSERAAAEPSKLCTKVMNFAQNN
jgi:hypothetical protein